MANIEEEKIKLRKQISSLKQSYTDDQLKNLSEEVLSTVEITGIFQSAKKIFIYYNLRDEVYTLDFIERWKKEKEFYLPVVKDENLLFCKYDSSSSFSQSKLGVIEPIGDAFTDYNKIDLIIVPGVAFDRQKNRMGRGKGYYDKFLVQTNKPKMGICFEFQLLDKIPADTKDIKMDYIVSENELIW